VRLIAADLVGIEPVLESLQALGTDITDLLARIDVAEAVAATIPHRERILLLNHRLARDVLQAHLDWLDAIERELAPARPARDHTRRPEDGALMEPSGRNPSQPGGNRGRSKAAKIGGSATRRSRRQPPKR
jgi:hypothetical protein